jgi:hypothetical protein
VKHAFYKTFISLSTSFGNTRFDLHGYHQVLKSVVGGNFCATVSAVPIYECVLLFALVLLVVMSRSSCSAPIVATSNRMLRNMCNLAYQVQQCKTAFHLDELTYKLDLQPDLKLLISIFVH